MLRLAVHPGGLPSISSTTAACNAPLIHRLKRKSREDADEALRELIDEVESYLPSEPPDSPATQPVVSLEPRTPLGDVSLFTIIATLGAPLEVTAANLAIETFLPTDAEARRGWGSWRTCRSAPRRPRCLGGRTLGDLLTEQARAQGAAGLVVDGFVRDGATIAQLGFPVFARGLSIRGTDKRRLGPVNHPISCGGIAVRPGDIVLGDADGVVVVGREHAAQVLDAARERERDEAEWRERFRAAKHRVRPRDKQHAGPMIAALTLFSRSGRIRRKLVAPARDEGEASPSTRSAPAPLLVPSKSSTARRARVTGGRQRRDHGSISSSGRPPTWAITRRPSRTRRAGSTTGMGPSSSTRPLALRHAGSAGSPQGSPPSPPGAPAR
jgi:Aldolase/RraA